MRRMLILAMVLMAGILWAGVETDVLKLRDGTNVVELNHADVDSIKGLAPTNELKEIYAKTPTNGSPATAVATKEYVSAYAESAGTYASIAYVTNHYTVATNDHTVLCYAKWQGITNTLPNATNVAGRLLTFKRLDYGTNNYVRIKPVTGQKIDGQTNLSLYQSMKAVTIQSYSTNWYIVGGY